MKELKFSYPKLKAEAVLKQMAAEFRGESSQEDFYLVSDDKDIYRLVKKDGRIKLVHFTKDQNGFGIDFSKTVANLNELEQIFENNPAVIKKIIRNYIWQGSKISTDEVIGLGEFVEVAVGDDKLQGIIFKNFGISEQDLVKKSYYDLWQEK